MLYNCKEPSFIKEKSTRVDPSMAHSTALTSSAVEAVEVGYMVAAQIPYPLAPTGVIILTA